MFGLDALGDPTARLQQIEIRLKAYRSTPHHGSDLVGLGHLLSGDLGQARAAFESSLNEDPDAEVALLFLGIVHLEAGRWAEAYDVLKQAEQHRRCMPTAELLSAWAKRCAEQPPADRVSIGLHLLAAIDALPPVEFDLSRAIAERFHYNESDVLRWAQVVAYDLRYTTVQSMLAKAKQARDPRFALAAVTAFDHVPSVDAELVDLLMRFPDDPRLRLHHAWRDLISLDDESLEEAWPHAQVWVDRALVRDPGNGAYELMRVSPVCRWTEIEGDQGQLDYRDDSEPYSPDEMKSLRRALGAPRFEYPGDEVLSEAHRLRREVWGGFARRDNLPAMGIRLGTVRNIARRYENTFDKLSAQGRLDEAVDLGETLIGVASRASVKAGDNPWMNSITGLSVRAMVAHKLQDYAAKTNDAALMRQAVLLIVECRRSRFMVSQMAEKQLLVERLPVQAGREAFDALCEKIALADDAGLGPVYRQMIRSHPDRSPDRLLTLLRAESHLPHNDRGYLFEWAIIALTDLRDAEALPTLRALTEDESLYYRTLSKWAVTQFEAAGKPAE
ncbi:MAG: tetratricopeptide repeat protein [Planctomycetota bacterium]